MALWTRRARSGRHDHDDPEPTDLLTVSLVTSQHTAVLTARGEVDLYTAPVLRSALDEAFENDPKSIVVDLTGITFFASSGLSVLLAGLDEAERRHCELRLAGCSRAVQRPLDIAGVGAYFEDRRTPGSAQGQDGSVDGQTVSSRTSQPGG